MMLLASSVKIGSFSLFSWFINGQYHLMCGLAKKYYLRLQVGFNFIVNYLKYFLQTHLSGMPYKYNANQNGKVSKRFFVCMLSEKKLIFIGKIVKTAQINSISKPILKMYFIIYFYQDTFFKSNFFGRVRHTKAGILETLENC